MNTWVEFDNTSYSILLHLGYKYFVFDGRDDELSFLYPFRQKSDAIKHSLKEHKGMLNSNYYIMTNDTPLRELADGIDLLDVKVLFA